MKSFASETGNKNQLRVVSFTFFRVMGSLNLNTQNDIENILLHHSKFMGRLLEDAVYHDFETIAIGTFAVLPNCTGLLVVCRINIVLMYGVR